MAKQTFTTGQVLTAAQMTSLQQTAMGGGSPSTKTASYVLTAADAGTTIQMNSASATTITVNTALFAAGDSVQIQNIGAGICTITAGTATVTTSGSLALGQWEGGFIFFTTTSAAIFFDYTQTGSVSPLTTKGDLWGYSTLDARIPIGTNSQVLTADSTQALGLKWATPSGSTKSYSLLSTTSLSGATTTISSLSGYDNFFVLVRGASTDTTGSSIVFYVNGANSATDYSQFGPEYTSATAYASSNLTSNSYFQNNGQIYMGTLGRAAAGAVNGYFTISGANTSGKKLLSVVGGGNYSGAAVNGQSMFISGAVYNGTAVISSITFFGNTGNLDAGTVYVYGAA